MRAVTHCRAFSAAEVWGAVVDEERPRLALLLVLVATPRSSIGLLLMGLQSARSKRGNGCAACVGDSPAERRHDRLEVTAQGVGRDGRTSLSTEKRRSSLFADDGELAGRAPVSDSRTPLRLWLAAVERKSFRRRGVDTERRGVCHALYLAHESAQVLRLYWKVERI
jgi:hypothetical protein